MVGMAATVAERATVIMGRMQETTTAVTAMAAMIMAEVVMEGAMAVVATKNHQQCGIGLALFPSFSLHCKSDA